MDESKWLSSEQVLNLIKDDKHNKNSQKILNYKDDLNFSFLSLNEKTNFIEKKLDQHFELMSVKNAKMSQQLGEIEWIDSIKKSVFIKLKNKPQYMGETINNKVYLNNEESLFLIETGSVICYYKSLQLSFQDAFELMLKSKKDLQFYSIYSYLTKFGFILKRYLNLEKDLKEKNLREKNLREKDLNEKDLEEKNLKEKFSNFESLKRSHKLENEISNKKSKLPSEEKKLNDLKINYLDNVIKDRFLINENFDINFFKFSRLMNLNQDDQNTNLELMKKKFENNSRKETLKHSFLIDGLNDIKEIINNKNLYEKIDNFKNFHDDFLIENDHLIKFDENLSVEEIQQRLFENGPKTDIYDDFLNDVNMEDFDFDYYIYLPSKNTFKTTNKTDYYLKILNTDDEKIPFEKILKLNSRIIDQSKILYTFCDSNDFNFYQVTNVDLQI